MEQARASGAYDAFIINDDLARAQQEAAGLVNRFVQRARSHHA